jgi:hypothetical protein
VIIPTLPDCHARLTAGAAATVCLMLAVAMPSSVEAQRRPGVNMGFYTTTDLPTLDVDVASVGTSSGQANSPRFTVSVVGTKSLKRGNKRALIAGLRATPLSAFNSVPCVRRIGSTTCQNTRFDERVGLLVGGAFDVRSTILRPMVGPTWYNVGGQGARFATTVRLDFASPRLRGPTPTAFIARSFLGSVRGEGTALTSAGVGLRWVRK